MSNYRSLGHHEIIKDGDEYTNSPTKYWSQCSGWEGKRVVDLIALIGDGGKMRRKSNKKVIRKVCVPWT